MMTNENEWISVSCPPTEASLYLGCNNDDGEMSLVWWEASTGFTDDRDGTETKLTHWRKLPLPPQDD